MFEWPQEILLEAEVSKFSFFKEFHRELPQGINSKDGDILIGVTADLPREQVMQVRLQVILESIQVPVPVKE